MTPYIKKAVGALRTKRLFASDQDVVRIVAEILYPETPEPERIIVKAKASFMRMYEGDKYASWYHLDPSSKQKFIDQETASYEAERKLVLGL